MDLAKAPSPTAARSYVKGYENLHGYKLRFETTWLRSNGEDAP
jgi:hypothetical protein